MPTLSAILGLNNGQNVTPILPLLPGQLPTFGSGRFRLFLKNTPLIIPAGVTSGRFRVGGGSGAKGENGGTSSIAALSLSATGGLGPTGSTGGNGGVGSGGDFQASGGKGGDTNGGGGGAGSQLGNGGNGGNGLYGDVVIGGGGGGVGGFAGGNASGNYAGGGGSPFEAGSADAAAHDLFGVMSTPSWVDGVMNASDMPILYPFFAFTGGGGYPGFSGPNARAAGRGGPGAGGGGGHDSQNGGFGGVGGGGGGGGAFPGDGGRVLAMNELIDPVSVAGIILWNSITSLRSRRLIGGGAGGYRVGGISYGGGGGGGYAHGVFNVTPGDTINIVVAQPGTQSAGGFGLFEY